MRVLLTFISAFRCYKWHMLLGLVLAILTMLASIGLLSLSGWFLSATALAGINGTAALFNYMLPAVGVRGSAIFRTVGRYAERLVSHDATFRVLAQLRKLSFSRLFPLSPGVILRYRQGDLLNRFVADIDTLDHLYIRLISPIFSAFFVIVTLTLCLSFFNPIIAFTLALILLILLLIMPTLFYYLSHSIGEQLTQLRAAYRVRLTALLRGNAELAIFSAESRFRRELDQTEQEWLYQQKRLSHYTAISQVVITLATGATAILILSMSAIFLSSEQSAAIIAFFIFVTLASFEILAPVSTAFLHLSHVIASANRVRELLSHKPDVTFPTLTHSDDLAENLQLTVSSVYFTYPQQPQPVLLDISLNIQPRQHVAIVGKTGCGKSTLLQLLTRAWDAQSGEIRFNQKVISDYDEQTLRKLVSVVTQRVHVFNDTLRNNLLIAQENATDEELITALKQVGLDALLVNDGLDCWVGESGRQLSGGEKRRLSIARALLHNAPLMLMDEPTEGLDHETEQQILSLLHQCCKDKTLIMIMHRLNGIDLMDYIYVMDAGRLVEQGSHSTLLAARNYYYRLYHSY